MTSREVRDKYLKFFEERGHKVIPSASLVPENDPTTLFTGSGMQPLIPYLLGAAHPHGKKLVNSQKSFRSQDIEEVGDNRHTTFFEMLGNWSLGDYFKAEQLPWFFEFLTIEIGIPQERLWVTCFEGDEKLGLPKDTESAEIWKNVGISEDHIRFYGSKKNWWSRSGTPDTMPAGEPGGPDSEMFYEFTDIEHDPKFGDACHPNCDCGRFLEIGNSVFMEYKKEVNGSFTKLPQRNVDFGGGLERITAAANNNSDIFCVDSLYGIIQQIQIWTKKRYSNDELQKTFRIVADHMRASVFMIGDGVIPSNTERGYFLRRLLRRSIVNADRLGIEAGSIYKLTLQIALAYQDSYPHLEKQSADIAEIIQNEEINFRKTLEKGLKEFEKMEWMGVSDGEMASENQTAAISGHARQVLSGEQAFNLFQSYGFPIELTIELAKEKGGLVEVERFGKLLEEHRALSRAGSEKKFKGGLGDTSEMSVKYHTATHLLHTALRKVLGEHVIQRGSNITPERLRFDFSHPAKMTPEEIKAVEDLVNEQIVKDLPVTAQEMPVAEAEKLGAIHAFGEKYGDVVTVYTVGEGSEIFSREFCGGPHVEHTGALRGHFKILKEEAVAQGIRRIKAVLE